MFLAFKYKIVISQHYHFNCISYQIKAALVRALYNYFTDPKHGRAHDFCYYSFLFLQLSVGLRGELFRIGMSGFCQQNFPEPQ